MSSEQLIHGVCLDSDIAVLKYFSLFLFLFAHSVSHGFAKQLPITYRIYKNRGRVRYLFFGYLFTRVKKSRLRTFFYTVCSNCMLHPRKRALLHRMTLIHTISYIILFSLHSKKIFLVSNGDRYLQRHLL